MADDKVKPPEPPKEDRARIEALEAEVARLRKENGDRRVKGNEAMREAYALRKVMAGAQSQD